MGARTGWSARGDRLGGAPDDGVRSGCSQRGPLGGLGSIKITTEPAIEAVWDQLRDVIGSP